MVKSQDRTEAYAAITVEVHREGEEIQILQRPDRQSCTESVSASVPGIGAE